MKIGNKITTYRDAGVKGGGVGRAGEGAIAPPVMGRSVNPIPTRGADFACHITTTPTPPRFLDDAASLYCEFFFQEFLLEKTDDRAIKHFKNAA